MNEVEKINLEEAKAVELLLCEARQVLEPTVCDVNRQILTLRSDISCCPKATVRIGNLENLCRMLLNKANRLSALAISASSSAYRVRRETQRYKIVRELNEDTDDFSVRISAEGYFIKMPMIPRYGLKADILCKRAFVALEQAWKACLQNGTPQPIFPALKKEIAFVFTYPADTPNNQIIDNDNHATKPYIDMICDRLGGGDGGIDCPIHYYSMRLEAVQNPCTYLFAHTEPTAQNNLSTCLAEIEKSV